MDAREYAIAVAQREQDEWDAAEAAISDGLARRTRRAQSSSSIVFTLRRNLIRNGLRGTADLAASNAVDRVIAAAHELRDLIA